MPQDLNIPSSPESKPNNAFFSLEEYICLEMCCANDVFLAHLAAVLLNNVGWLFENSSNMRYERLSDPVVWIKPYDLMAMLATGSFKAKIDV